MEVTTITKRIILESKYIDKEIRNHLLNKLNDTVLKDCSREHGYILKILEITHIVEHFIERSNSQNIFVVEFRAEVLKPIEGLRIKANICMVYKDGLFLNIMDKQKMLIPKSNLTEYNFDDTNQIYVHKKIKDKSLKQEDEVEAIITAVGYNSKKFSCFGKIIEN